MNTLLFGSFVFLAGNGMAVASPDIVRIALHSANDGNRVEMKVDHVSRQDSAWPLPHWIVTVRCEEGKDNPVAFTNESSWEIGLVSSLGIAKLAPANEIGAHSATFRSVPKGQYVFRVRAGGFSGDAVAELMLECAWKEKAHSALALLPFFEKLNLH